MPALGRFGATDPRAGFSVASILGPLRLEDRCTMAAFRARRQLTLYFSDIASMWTVSSLNRFLRYSTPMIHVVEVRFAGENFRSLLLRVRGWLNTENAWPSTFRYSFS